MSDSVTTEVTRIEALKAAIARLGHLHAGEAKARDDRLRNINMAWDFWSKGQPELAASEKTAFAEQFKATDRKFAELQADLAEMADNALQLVMLREENRKLAAQLAEVADFRARLNAFLQGA